MNSDDRRGLQSIAPRVFHSRAALLLAGQVLTAGTAFGLNILSASVMSPTERGTLAFFLQLAYTLTTLSLLGVERPYAASKSTSFGTALRDLAIITAWRRVMWPIGIALAVTLALTGNESSALLFGAALLYVGSNSWVRFVRIAFIASGEATIYLSTLLGSHGLLIITAVALRLADISDPLFWLSAYAVSAGVALVVGIVKARGPTISNPSAELVADLRRRGVRLLPASFGNTAMLRSDRLLMPLLSSSAELGRYAVVATIMEVANWPIQQWVDSSLRRWSEAGTNRFRKRMVVRVLASVLIGVCVMGAVAFATVSFLLPDEYASATNLVLPLALGTVIYSLTRVQQGLLVAQGRSWTVSGVELSGMVASVLLYVLLIPQLGALGAALGSAIGYTVCFFAGVAASRRSSPSMS